MPTDFAAWPSRRSWVPTLGVLGAVSLLGPRRRTATVPACPAPLEDIRSAPADRTLRLRRIPGPYPPHSILRNSPMLRRRIAEGRRGMPLDLRLKLVDGRGSPLADAALYLWHCDADGAYSGFPLADGLALGQTFCRGIQLSDARGLVAFDSILPGRYDAGAAHLHLQLFLPDGEGGVASAAARLLLPDHVGIAPHANAATPADESHEPCFGLPLRGDVRGYRAALTLAVAVPWRPSPVPAP